MPQAKNSAPQMQFEVDDAIVLLLGAESRVPSLAGRLEGITRLEKLIFLLERESQIGKILTEDTDFRAYDFGPFSSKIYQAVETLEAAGLIQENVNYTGGADDAWETVHIVGTDAPYASREFELTERGKRYFEALRKELPPDLAKEVGSIKDRFASMPLRQLVRYVYKRYPKYTEKSKIRDEILR